MVNGHNDERNVPDERHTHSPAHDTDAEPSPETMTLADVANAQDAETEEYARVFLLKAMRLRGVAINREHFLRAELRRRGISEETITAAIALTPIKFETSKSSLISFTSGLPGGFAVLAAIPADLLQYFIHAFRIMQKIAYTYGWQNLIDDVDEIDDETFAKMVTLLGVMMGVSSASTSIKAFATGATKAVQKQVTNAALTKTAWYGPMKKVLRVVGIKITKDTVGKGISKAVPVLGGIISGGMTFATLTTESNRLKKHLRELPPPGVDGAEFKKMVSRLGKNHPTKFA